MRVVIFFNMITQELKAYIREQLNAGAAKEAIKSTLVKSGWSDGDLEDAFVAVAGASPAPVIAASPINHMPAPAQNLMRPASIVAPAQQANRMPVSAQNLMQPTAAHSHKGTWAIVVIVLVLLIAGGALFLASAAGLISLPFLSQSATTTPSTTINAASSTVPVAPNLETNTTQPPSNPAPIITTPAPVGGPSTTTSTTTTTITTSNTTLSSLSSNTGNPAPSASFDTVVKANLRLIQGEADIFRNGAYGPGPTGLVETSSGTGSYGVAGNSCSGPGSVFSVQKITAALALAQTANGGGAVGSGTPPTCNNTATAYAISSKLYSMRKAGVPDYWCVDSTGNSSVSTTPLGKATVCPTAN